jgi:hypothetical protein
MGKVISEKEAVYQPNTDNNIIVLAEILER